MSRADQDGRNALIIRDAEPIRSMDDIWASAAQIATVGIFIMLAGVCLYFCRPILLPILAAIVIGMTLAPLVKRAHRLGIPSWLSAVVLAVAMLLAVAIAASLLAAPVSEWIGRAPEIGATIKQRFSVLDRPLGSLRELQNLLEPSSSNVVAVEIAAAQHGDAGACLRHAGGGRDRDLLRHFRVLSGRPDGIPPLHYLVLSQP